MTAAPPLLLPGLMCSDVIWAPQVAALAGHAPVAVPGYGDARSFEEMARRALAMAPERFSLAGHSMGARIALEVFRQAPERVERIALFDTGVHPVQPGEAEKRHALRDLGRREGIGALVDAWLPPMVHPDRHGDEELMGRLRAMCVEGGIARYEAQIAALLARPDPRPLLPEIRCPALIAAGREDLWSPPVQHEEIAAAMPDAELAIFEHCGHMAPVEAPDAVTAALRAWLARPA